MPPAPRRHLIASRFWETVIGLGIALIGIYLIWDAWDNRGKKLPWPVSGLAPW